MRYKINIIVSLLFLLSSYAGFSQVIISGNGEIVATDTANIILQGDWTNNANNTGFTGSAGGVVLFKGSSQQSINGSKSTTFTGMYLKNNAGLKLNSDITVTGNFDLRGGIVDATSSTLLFTGSGKTRYAKKSQHIKGPVSRIGSTIFRYDVGDGTKYAPLKVLSLNTTAKSATITVQYYKSAAPGGSNVSAPLVKVSDVEYWNVSSSASGSQSKVDLFWKDGAESGIKSINADSLRFARFDGSNWVDEAATIDAASTISSGDIQINNAISIDNVNVTFGSTNNVANPLPIQLLSFTAQCQEQDVVINWSTASEENNDYFTLLRSEDAAHYEEIATLIGAGNSNTVINYTYTDWNAAGGNFYYMLKQTDYDGKNETFNPIFVNCDNNNKDVELSTIYDNDNIYARLSYAKQGDNYTIVIIDMLGKTIFYKEHIVNSENYLKLPTQTFKPGLYNVVYYNENASERLSSKFIIR